MENWLGVEGRGGEGSGGEGRGVEMEMEMEMLGSWKWLAEVGSWKS